MTELLGEGLNGFVGQVKARGKIRHDFRLKFQEMPCRRRFKPPDEHGLVRRMDFGDRHGIETRLEVRRGDRPLRRAAGGGQQQAPALLTRPVDEREQLLVRCHPVGIVQGNTAAG